MSLYPPYPISRFYTHDPTAVSLVEYLWRFDPPLPAAPIISPMCMNRRVTRLAQRNQIAPIVCATFTQWFLVMNFLCRYKHAFFITKFTERMQLHIAITNPLPCSTISSPGIWITSVLFILAVPYLGVFLTVSAIH